jgi:hypothetical protein
MSLHSQGLIQSLKRSTSALIPSLPKRWKSDTINQCIDVSKYTLDIALLQEEGTQYLRIDNKLRDSSCLERGSGSMAAREVQACMEATGQYG